MKNNKKKGFTLAELLIVVAIIAVLVLIAIPVFTSSLDKSKVATDKANCRSYYAELQADYLDTDTARTDIPTTASDEITFIDGSKVKLQKGTVTVTAPTGNKGYKVEYTTTVANGSETWGN